jgi:hypothetical protein
MASGGLFQGTLTASQILAEGGIPLTTTTAASNPTAGRYSSQFSGAQSLALGSVPFVMADDSCTIAVGKIDGVPGVAKTPYLAAVKGDSYTTVSGLAFDNNGRPLGQWYDGTTAAAITHGSVVLTTVVMTARKIGNSKVLRVNGVQSGSANTTVLANTAVTNAYIGNSSGAVGATLNSATYALNGSIGPVLLIKGTVSDADLLVLERFVSSLTPNGPQF